MVCVRSLRGWGKMQPLTDSVWLISGIPGAGKSSVSKALAESLSKSVHIEVDLVREMVVTGYVAPGQDPRAESDAQLELGAHYAALLADSFMDAGFTPLIDDVILRRQLARYREVLSRWPLRLVVLAPPIEVVLQRDRERVGKHLGGRFAYLDGGLREQIRGLGLWLDTSGMTVRETIEVIMRRADEAILDALP